MAESMMSESAAGADVHILLPVAGGSPSISAAANLTGFGGNLSTPDGDVRLLQPAWDFLLGYESTIASPLFPIVLSLAFYLVAMIPFTVVDLYVAPRWTWLRRYKIQPDRQVGWPQVRRAAALTGWNHLLYILPVSVAQVVWTPDTVLPPLAPTVWEFVWHQTAALLVFDAEYYLWHLLHHRVRWLYRHVHSVHHQFSSPSVWVSEYLHPWELFSIGVFTTTSPMLFGAHPLTVWVFMLFSIVISVDGHCGYDVPLLPHRWLPVWGGSVHHDMHHQRPLTNFEPFLNHWDRLFGSYCPPLRAGGFKNKSLNDWEKKPNAVMEFEFGQADAPKLAAG